MLKLSSRMFATATFCVTTAVLGGDVIAQLTPTPAPPRRDTPEKQDERPALDSRAGGALSREAVPGDVPEVDEDVMPAPSAIGDDDDGIVDDDGIRDTDAVRDSDANVITGDEAEVAGVVADVSENRLVLKVRPVGRTPAREVDFQVSEATKVTRNGEPAELMSLIPGDSVRIETAPGDDTVIVRIMATEELKGSVNTIEGNPNVVRDEDGRRRGRMASDHEEAVLPLGIEVYGVSDAALVTEMLIGGPAENGGLKIGDLIVAINGDPIPDPERIEEMVAKSAGGVELTIHRGDQQMNVTLSPARVVQGALIDPVEIRRNLSSYGTIIGPVDGSGVRGAGVRGGVAVPGGGVDVEIDPDDPRGAAGVIGSDGVRMRNNGTGDNFRGREPGTDPRSNVEGSREPGTDPRSNVPTNRVPGDDPRSGVNSTREPGEDPREPFEEQAPAPTDVAPAPANE